MSNILLISSDSSEKDVIIDVIKSLERLNCDTNEIFKRITLRLVKCQERIHKFNQRLNLLDEKIENLQGVINLFLN